MIASVPPVISFLFKTNKIQPQSVSLVVCVNTVHVTFGSVFFHGGCVIAAAVHGTRLVYTLNVYYLSFFFMIVKNNPPQKKTVSLIFLFLGTPSLFLCVLFLIFRESIIINGAWELRKKKLSQFVLLWSSSRTLQMPYFPINVFSFSSSQS